MKEKRKTFKTNDEYFDYLKKCNIDIIKVSVTKSKILITYKERIDGNV